MTTGLGVEGVDSIEPPDNLEEPVHVTLTHDAGGQRRHVLPRSQALRLFKAFRHFKLTKRGRNIGVLSRDGYLAFDLQNICEIEVKVRDFKRFAAEVESSSEK